MKKFIAFNGSTNSGIQTKEKAIEWAAQAMTQKHGCDKIHIAEITDIVERTVPTVKVSSFLTEDNEPKLKAVGSDF